MLGDSDKEELLRGAAARIALPEGGDARVVAAARRAAADGVATPVFLRGALSDEQAREVSAWAEVVSPSVADYAGEPVGGEETSEAVFLAAAMLRAGEVDGVVAGAATTTATVVRVALRVVGLREGIATVSGFFLMKLAGGKTLLFADCALVAEPSEAQLVDIAVASARSGEVFLDEAPRLAMLSFSTASSSDHPAAQKVRAAAATVRRRHPQWEVAGEVQADAALNPDIARRKGVGLRRGANVLIFPDLHSGNIAYKLVQQLTGCVAVGPVLQGLRRPMNDLSRGATAADIAQMITLTAQQSRQVVGRGR